MMEHGHNHKKCKRMETRKKSGEEAECLMNFAQQLSKDEEEKSGKDGKDESEVSEPILKI